MNVTYSDHAKKRMKQRGINELEIMHILDHPFYMKKRLDGRREVIGELRNRQIKIVFIQTESYIRIVTII